MSALEPSPPGSHGIDEAAVVALAKVADLVFRPEELPAIAEQLRRACAIASPLLTCELDEADDSGPIWRP